MTTASFLSRAALGILLVMAGLIVVTVRVSTAAQAGQQKAGAVKPAAASQVVANSEIWDVEGVVVDEQDRPVAGATVRTMPVFDGPANVAVKTGADGTFRFALRPSPMSLVGLMAETDGGARMGLDSAFDRRRVERIKDPARIVLKPSKSVTVRVKDGTGQPVPGAMVEAAEISFRTHVMTGADGLARLRIPTDAHVEWVIGFKPKAGLDYFDSWNAGLPQRPIAPCGCTSLWNWLHGPHFISLSSPRIHSYSLCSFKNGSTRKSEPACPNWAQNARLAAMVPSVTLDWTVPPG